MRILFCCEFYAPSVGGVQEVMRQLAERLVLRGHEVTVATTALPNRNYNELNGVKVKEFQISGNLVRGMTGELEAYRHFATCSNFDIVMIKAAQQWTFDTLWPVLHQIRTAKIFIPCGFSSFYEPAYTDYFRQLPYMLRQFDHLIFYASDYRDINFAMEHRINNFSIIPNGASEMEFSVAPDPCFRQRHGIGADDFLYLTVGSFTGLKGHLEVVKAFSQVGIGERPATLILNGNKCITLDKNVIDSLKRMFGGAEYFLKYASKMMLRKLGIQVGKNTSLSEIAATINKRQNNKKVLITDFPRPELVQAFMTADLFVFASNIEYSPLVLYESAAAGTPFLSIPVGNAEEIARWTGAGEICPAQQNERGYTSVDPDVLAEHMSRLAKDEIKLTSLGAAGKNSWQERFTWEKITSEYEKIFMKFLAKKAAAQ